jgi:TRAP transporter 4TM/12TM fusion protein
MTESKEPTLAETVYIEEGSSAGPEAEKRSLLDWIIRILAVVFTIYMFFATIYGPYKTTIVHRALFLVVMLFIFFSRGKPLRFGKNNRFPLLARTIDWTLIVAATGALGYVIVRFEDVLRLFSATQLQNWQIVLATIILVAVLETARRTSITFFILALLGVLYTMFGHHLPGMLNHPGMSFQRMIFLTVFTEEGVFGLGLAVASTFLFMFILFGAVLQGTGASVFLMNICNGLVGKYDGGAAKTAVIGSAMMGTVSGSSISNVVTVGSITIPLMKRLGFRPHVAAAIEVTASEGGQIMPPVMGAAAFIMAEMTAIPYSTIALAAVIPAILYYINAFYIVHFEAKKSGIKGLAPEEVPDWKKEARAGWHVILPIGVLFYLLMVRANTAMYAGMFCILLTFIAAQVKKSTRLSFSRILDIIDQGVRDVAGIVAILAGLGLVTQAIIITGLGARLTDILVAMVGGSATGLVIVAVVATLILGCGMTTPVAYSLVAIFVAPSMVAIGYPVLAAHMFLFFFAIKSGSTPPVAVVSAVAAGIAGSDFWRTCITGTFFGLPSFIVAFGYLINPALLLMGEPSVIILTSLAAVVGVIAMAASLQGWLFTRCNRLEQIVLFFGAVGLIVPEPISSIGGLVLVCGSCAYSYLKSKKQPAPADVLPAPAD